MSGGTYSPTTIRNYCANLAGAYRITVYAVTGAVVRTVTVQLAPNQGYTFQNVASYNVKALG